MAKKLKAKHLFDLTFVSEAQLSPDGKQVAAVQTTVHQPDDKEKPPEYRSHIFLYGALYGAADEMNEGGVQLTHSGESNTRPRFSPDGTQLAFVSKRGEAKPQLYLLPLGGGEARPLTDLKAGVGEFDWHPSGQKLAFVSRGNFEDEAAKKGRGRSIDRLFSRSTGSGLSPTNPLRCTCATSRPALPTSSPSSRVVPTAWPLARTERRSTSSPPKTSPLKTPGRVTSGRCH